MSLKAKFYRKILFYFISTAFTLSLIEVERNKQIKLHIVLR